eukprot:scaffold656177_cov50-Prasinocladus_malaysianus.AAC.1
MSVFNCHERYLDVLMIILAAGRISLPSYSWPRGIPFAMNFACNGVLLGAVPSESEAMHKAQLRL